jgi:hypothetical protein
MTSDVSKTHKLSPDGKTLVPKPKRLNISAELKKKAKTKLKYSGRKPDAFRV